MLKQERQDIDLNSQKKLLVLSCLSQYYHPILLKSSSIIIIHHSNYALFAQHRHYPKTTNYFDFPWNGLMPDQSFLRTLQKSFSSKSWQTKQGSFTIFPIPSVFHAYNLRVGCIEQLLTMNCHTATYISLLWENITRISFWPVCSMYFYHSCSGKVTAFPPISLYASHIDLPE